MLQGTPTRAIYSNGGVTISTLLIPLQAGSVGEIIDARNPQAGTIVKARVGEDGSWWSVPEHAHFSVSCSLIAAGCQAMAAPSRIKDITFIEGVRDNQLVGYGLVVGLQATGDSLRNAPFTEQSVRSMLDRLGVNVPAGAVRAKNVAAVIVTATLPPFVGKGERIDVTVSSLGDATSLAGGQLVMTPLVGADGQTYAVAQGPLAVGGFSAQGAAEKLTEGIPTSGRISNGAIDRA